jgi:hypothetical protein
MLILPYLSQRVYYSLDLLPANDKFSNLSGASKVLSPRPQEPFDGT